MTATKILWGQILLVLGTALVGVWGATQFVAWRLAFQPELGAAWFQVGGIPVYLPTALFWWRYHFDAYPCLGHDTSVDLRGPLRSSEADQNLKRAIGLAIGQKPAAHQFMSNQLPRTPALSRRMNLTGG